MSDPLLIKMLKDFYVYAAQKLNIKNKPKILLLNDTKNAEDPYGYTGNYDPKTKTIRIYTTNRNKNDIVRSFSHELIHHYQYETGKLTDKEQKINGYAQNDPILRKAEVEAYARGSIIYRDWQDKMRKELPKK